MNRISIGEFKKNSCLIFLFILLIIITWLYTFSQTKVNMDALKQFIDWINNPDFTYKPLNLDGLFPAILGTIQIVLLGMVATKSIIPDLKDRFQTILVSIALGFGFTGLIVILLSYLKILYFYTLLLTLWSLIIFFIYYGPKNFLKNFPLFIQSYIKILKNFEAMKLENLQVKWKFEWIQVEIIIIGIIFFAIYYHAIMFPPLEVDSIIYHAPLASIIFREHGLPFIAGGGVGIGLSANYPFLFSALGSYYYLLIGSVQDLFLRIITPTMGILSILATYCIGKEIGGKRVGMLSAFLFSIVPSFLSYSYLNTQETTIIFFLAMGVLFLIKAIDNKIMGYWIVSGSLFGFALLTSYQALYFISALVILLGYYYIKGNGDIPRSNYRQVLMMIFSMIVIGGAPYIRNLIVLHNPVYPFFNQFFNSEFISPWLYEYTKRSLDYTASYIVTGENTASTFDFISSVLIYPSFYPLNALLVIPAILVFLFSDVRMKKVILAFALIPSLLIILNKPSFIRYLWLAMPYSSVMVGCMFSKGFDICNKLRYDMLIRSTRLFLSCLIVMILILALPAVISGSAYVFIVPIWSKLDTQHDYLWYTKNPNIDKQILLDKYYGDDAYAWNFLNNNMGNNDRVATFETRIYYIKNSSFGTILSLDNKEAEKLYQTYNVNDTISILKQDNVKFLFEREGEEEKELFSKLPLRQSLGSSYFPIVYEKGGSKIYNVGPLSNDILENYLQENLQENIEEFKLPRDESSSLLIISDKEKYEYGFIPSDDNIVSTSSTGIYKDKGYIKH